MTFGCYSRTTFVYCANSNRRAVRRMVLFLAFVSCTSLTAYSQNAKTRAEIWGILQVLPSYAWELKPEAAFAFEWEVAPAIWSFGMDPHAASWHSFYALPPARFTGSIEWIVDARIYTHRVVTSSFGWGTGVRAHLPLIARGETLAATLGLRYRRTGGWDGVEGELGMSTLFGFLEPIYRHALSGNGWGVTLAFRMF
jgi:hypothetical protein